MIPRERDGTDAIGGPQLYAPRRVCPLCDTVGPLALCPRDGMSTLRLDAPRSDPDRLQAGMLIAERYRIQKLIGTGGFAKVFSAAHTGTGQNVALKILGSGGGLDDEQALRRFFREARASAALRHPNTVRVFDFGQDDDGTVFLAMELLTGMTVRALQVRRLKEGRPFSEVEALEIALEVCQSLAEAHSMGMVHRDIGPNNVFLHEVPGSDPVVKLLDFGLVKEDGHTLTRAHQVFGTVAYMSPEQVLGRAIGPRSDLYSLGITMWWLLAGAQPFVGPTKRDVMWGHLHTPLPSLVERSGGRVSENVERVIARAAAKDVDARFQDAIEMRAAIETCLLQLRAENARAFAPTQILPARTTLLEPPPPPPATQPLVPAAAPIPTPVPVAVVSRLRRLDGVVVLSAIAVVLAALAVVRTASTLTAEAPPAAPRVAEVKRPSVKVEIPVEVKEVYVARPSPVESAVRASRVVSAERNETAPKPKRRVRAKPPARENAVVEPAPPVQPPIAEPDLSASRSFLKERI